MVRVTPAFSCSREARPGLRRGVRSPRRKPRWSAERRAVLARTAAAPEASSGGNIRRLGAAPRHCAFRRSASPSFIWRRQLSWRSLLDALHDSGAKERRENAILFRDSFSPPPAERWGGVRGGGTLLVRPPPLTHIALRCSPIPSPPQAGGGEIEASRVRIKRKGNDDQTTKETTRAARAVA
jgi:hypothetical protein